jgi:hypothetical protein
MARWPICFCIVSYVSVSSASCIARFNPELTQINEHRKAGKPVRSRINFSTILKSKYGIIVSVMTVSFLVRATRGWYSPWNGPIKVSAEYIKRHMPSDTELTARQQGQAAQYSSAKISSALASPVLGLKRAFEQGLETE